MLLKAKHGVALLNPWIRTLGYALATLNQPMIENLGIRIRILDPLFMDETRIKNIKNLQSMRVKQVYLTIVLMCKLNSL